MVYIPKDLYTYLILREIMNKEQIKILEGELKTLKSKETVSVVLGVLWFIIIVTK